MNKMIKLTLGVLVIVAVVGGVYMYGKKSVVSAAIKIGSIESLTGNAAYYGGQNQKGVEIAREELVNRYPDMKLEVYHEDSLYTPKGGVDAYQKLISANRISAVIAHASPVAMAIKPLAQENGVAEMAVSSSVGTYSSPNDFSFRTSAKTDLEAEPMVRFMNGKYKKLAFLYMNNEIGKSIVASIKSEIGKQNADVQIVAEENFLIDSSDFKTSLAKIKQENADAVYVVGLGANIANIVKQSDEIGMEAQLLGFRSTEDPVVIKNAGELANGFIYTYHFDANSDNGQVKKFVSAYNEKYGELPDGFAAEGYEGMRLLGEAYAKCAGDNECAKNYLANLKNHDSIFGPLSFDENGDPQYGFFLKQIQNGKFVRLDK